MLKHILIMPVLLLSLTSCMNELIDDSTDSINMNSYAIQRSTEVINENARLIEESNRVVEQNQRLLQKASES